MGKNTAKLVYPLFLLLGISVVTTCKKLERLMAVSTGKVTNVLTNAAEVSGEVIDVGEGIVQHGHCYGKTPNVSISDTKTELGSMTDTGRFSSQLNNLEPGTRYYIKAYVSDGNEIEYGSEISFPTASFKVPSLTTASATAVTTTSAMSGGNISSDGGIDVTARGVCWSTSQNPDISDDTTSNGAGTGNFTSKLTGLSPGVTYYVKAYATNAQGTGYGNQISFPTESFTVPSLTTNSITFAKSKTAIGGGNITSNGGAEVTARGVCWSTSQNPNISNYTTSDGAGTGGFTSNLTGLTPNETYYVKAYATNTQGTGYGNQVEFKTNDTIGTFTDSRDGHEYKWIEIGNQIWMAENLAYLSYVYPPTLESSTSLFYYVYGYEGVSVGAAKITSNYTTYGALYNWPAAMNGDESSNANPSGVQGVCPSGWHLPSDIEWTELTDYLGGGAVAGGEMKEIGFTHWNNPNEGATNSSGFTALGGGYRYLEGYFRYVGVAVLYWSATEYNALTSWTRMMHCNVADVYRGEDEKEFGFSIRCVKD